MKETVEVKDGVFSMSLEENGHVISASPQDMNWIKYMLVAHGVDVEADIRNILKYEMQEKLKHEANNEN